MSQILITDNQLERLTRFMIKEQAEKNPLLKLFYKHLSDTAKLYWDGKNFSCRKKKIKCLTDKDKKEMLESFARWINKNPYVKEKPNKRISVITISGKQEKEEVPNIIPTDSEEVCVPVFLSTIKIISDGQTQPFENNSTKLEPGLIEALNDVALIASDFKDEGKPVNIVDFTIRTSSSRYRNKKTYLGKSFSKLSQDRALAVQQYVQDTFGPLGIKVPKATIDATGGNNDGSSGPNPPKPNNVVYDEGETQKSYTGGDIEEHRGDFNTPHNSSQEYEQYKYAVVTIGLETTFPEEEELPEDEPAALEQSSTPVEITNWKVRFYPKRKTKNKKKRNPPRFKTPKSNKIKTNWSTECGKKEQRKHRGKAGFMMVNEYRKMGKILITEKQLEILSRRILREQSVVPRETFNKIQTDLNYLLSQKVETDPNILNKFSVVIHGLEERPARGMTVTIGGAHITLKHDPPNAQRSSPEWGFWLTEPIYGRRISTKGFISELVEKDRSYGEFFKNYPEVKDQIETGTVKLEVTHDVMHNGALLIFGVASTKKPKDLKNLPSLGHKFNLGTFYNDNKATVRLSKDEYGTLHSSNLSYTLTSLVLKEPDWGGEDEIASRIYSFAAGEMFNFNKATITEDAKDELNQQIINPIRSMEVQDRNAYIQKLISDPLTVTAYASRDDDPSETPYYTEETKIKLHQACIGENTRGEYNQCLSDERAHAVADYLSTTVSDIFGDVTFNSVGGGENCDSGNCWTKGKKNHKSATTQSDRRFELTLPALVIK